MKTMTIQSNDKVRAGILQNGASLFVLVVLAVLVYGPLIGTGFTTNDDTLISTNWVTGYTAAVAQGRLGFFISTHLLQAPYALDSSSYYNAMRFGAPLFLLATLYVLISNVYRSHALATLVVTYFLAFIQNGWEQNLLTSYPFAFNIQFSSFLASLLVYHFYLRSGRIIIGVIAAVLYGLTLALESFFLYGIVFCVMAATHARVENPVAGFRKVLEITLKKLKPILIVGTVYLVAYIAWRYAHPSTYSGNTIKFSDPLQIFAVIWNFSISALPGYKFFNNEPQYAALLTGHELASYNLKTLISEMRTEWIVKAMLAAYVSAVALKSASIRAIPYSSIAFAMTTSLVCVFVPNVLVGFTDIYREWLRAGSTSYHYTYFSFIAVVVFFGFLSIAIAKVTNNSKGIATLAIVFMSTAVAGISLVTDFHNHYVTNDQKLSQRKWKVIDLFIKTVEFSNLPSNVTIYAPSLFDYRNIMAIHANYWSDYVSQKTGKKITVLKELPKEYLSQSEKIVYIKFLQDPIDDNQLLVFTTDANVDRILTLNQVTANTATIFSYSVHRGALLSGYSIQGMSQGNIWIDDSVVGERSGAGFAQSVRFSPGTSVLPSIKIYSDQNLVIDNLSVSYFPVHPRLSPVDVTLGDAFYAWENTGKANSHSWSEGSATLLLRNYLNKRVKAEISMEMTSLIGRDVSFTENGVKKIIHLSPDKWIKVKINENLPSGTSPLALSTDFPASSAGSTDSRKLAFAIRNLNISVAEVLPELAN